MDWMNTKQKRIALNVNTVADLISALQKLPQDYPIKNVDEGDFCEITVATDGKDKIVMLY